MQEDVFRGCGLLFVEGVLVIRVYMLIRRMKDVCATYERCWASISLSRDSIVATACLSSDVRRST